MTNEALQQLIDEFGDRISAIVFDNKAIVFFGHQGSFANSVSEIEFKTLAGVDMVGIPVYPRTPRDREKGVKFMYWHTTHCIQTVCTVDADHPDYLVDPAWFG